MSPDATPTANPPHPKLRWYQYRLRSLFLLMLLATIPLGWLSVKLKAAREQKAAVEAIQELDGDVCYDYQNGWDDGTSEPPGPAWLHKWLGDDVFVNVTGLRFESTEANWRRLTDDALKNLKAFPRLEELSFEDGHNITDHGLECLEGLTRLQVLRLSDSQTSDAALKHLTGLTQLQVLDLSGTKVSGGGLEHLAGLARLQELNLAETKVSDTGLKYLKGFTKLQLLDLRDTTVSDAGLEHLKGLTRLQWLDLSGTEVTDAGLEHLKGLTQLQELYTAGTRVSDAALKKLQKALPTLKSIGYNSVVF
jgi:hypothetical protein